VCRTAADVEFDYGDPQGAHRLREVLTGYLRRVRAVDTCSANVVVCGGFQQGLGLVLRVLGGPVAFEDPGAVTTITRLTGGAAIPVPVDGQGIDVDVLAASGARVVVVTPAHQWPTGVVLAPARRHALVAWAREHDAYDAEFRYDREPVGSLQGLAPDRVIGLGTVSKSLAPALRLGWAVLPSALAREVVAAKAIADRGTPQLDQLALATLVESGRYDRHLRRMRAEYAARRDALVSALAQLAPAVRVTGLAAGFHAVAHLPAGVTEPDVVAAARERRVGLYGMSTYRSTHDPAPAQLVLGFGNTSQHEIRTGIGLVADLLTSPRPGT
jgi:GntR family transcriptional regulator/MocR family aminotransferase